jgi:hypothetical protein
MKTHARSLSGIRSRFALPSGPGNNLSCPSTHQFSCLPPLGTLETHVKHIYQLGDGGGAAGTDKEAGVLVLVRSAGCLDEGAGFRSCVPLLGEDVGDE